MPAAGRARSPAASGWLPPWLTALVPVAAALAALLLAALPLAAAGAPVLEAYRVMLDGALGAAS